MAFVERMKEEAAAQYRNDLLVWAAMAPHMKKKAKPPQIPAVLRDDGDS